MADAAAPKLLSIEMARGLAAIIVVLYHAARHLDKTMGFPGGKQAFQFGHAGVDFFFVISGFIILFIHGDDLGRPHRLSHYGLRRFTRIYPIYWVILGVTIALMVAGGHALPPVLDMAWAATLLPTRDDPMVGVAWTLQHEIIFYGLFAILILQRRIGVVLLTLWFAAIALNLMTDRSVLATIITSAYNLEFFFGMAVALWLRRGTVPFARALFWSGLAAFSIAAGAEVLGLLDGYQSWARLAYGGPSAFIILGLVEMEQKRGLRVPKQLLWLGRASYSIYLFHLTGIGLFYKLWSAAGMMERAPPWISYGLMVIAGIAGSVVVSLTVEYPLMRWIRRRTA